MSEGISREEYNTGMARIHERMDVMSASSIRMEESSRRTEQVSEHISEKIDKMFEVMFGNGRGEGVLTKLKGIKTQLSYHWWLIGIILVGLVGGAWHLIGALLRKGGGS